MSAPSGNSTTTPTTTKVNSSDPNSLIEIKKQAEAGDAKAQIAFAEQFVALQKFTLAERWYRAAALQGESAAMVALGDLYASNRGSGTNLVKANPTNSVALYKLAASLGHSKAHMQLAQAYRNGIGARKDVIRAYSHYKLSGAPGVQPLLNQIIPEMSQEQIDAAERMVANFKPANFQQAFGDLVFESVRISGIFGAADRRMAMLDGKPVGAGQKVDLNVGGLIAQVKFDEITSDGVFVTYGTMERKIKPQRL